MRRADRLIALVDRLKRRRLTRAEDLAEALEVSVRTVYRDIAALQAHGLAIEGQAGVGYMVRGPVTLPALAFNHDQMEALALGLAFVEQDRRSGSGRGRARCAAQDRRCVGCAGRFAARTRAAAHAPARTAPSAEERRRAAPRDPRAACRGTRL
jgi:predicted DNA-binding transcriptional regulator YafY